MGVDVMFNPEEWLRQWVTIQGKKRIIYINEHTGLEKMRSTFTIEQQNVLDEYKNRLIIQGLNENREGR